MKRIFSIILALLMICLSLASCSSDGDDASGASDSSVITNSEDVSGLTIENLGDAEGNPREFTIMTRDTRDYYIYATEESLSAGRVEQETYKRNSEIESLYNIKFNVHQAGAHNAEAEWMNKLLAATGEYDLCTPQAWWKFHNSGVFYDIGAMPEIDLSEGHWYQGWNDEVTLNGKLFGVTGDATLEAYECMMVIFFNKTITNSHHLDMYELVDTGKWTGDKLIELGIQMSSGLDDDNANNDIWGMIGGLYTRRALLSGFGLQVAEKTSDGVINLIPDKEKVLAITDKVSDVIRSDAYSGSNDSERGDDYPSKFIAGKSVFLGACLWNGTQIKAGMTTGDYGIVPMPTYAEGDSYRSHIYNITYFAVPLSVKDVHASALILNALNYLSKDTIVNGFYDNVCKGQMAGSPDDVRMMDLCRDSISNDFAFTNVASAGKGMDLWLLIDNAVYSGSGVATAINTANVLRNYQEVEKILEAYYD